MRQRHSSLPVLVLSILAVAGAAPAQEGRRAAEPPSAPLDTGDPATWNERHLELRWVVYRADMERHPADKQRKEKWVRWLGERRDFELLEWITVYEGWNVAGAELRRQDAPQWLRAALWNLASSDSHDIGAARKALTEDGARVLGWVRRFPVVRRGADVEAFLAELERSFAPADPGDQLPPLDDAAMLLSWFDVPRDLAVLTPEDTVTVGTRYLHQVVRALRGAHTRAAFIAPHVAKIVQLLQHPHATVRAEAAAALGRLPGRMLPHERLLALAAAPGDAVLRRLTTLVLKHSTHPAAYFALHEIAADASHPGMAAARQGLAGMGDEFTVAFMAEFGIQVEGLDTVLQARARLEPAQRQSWLQTVYERAAWAAASGHPAAQLAARALLESARGLAPHSLAAVRALEPTVNESRWVPDEALRVELNESLVRMREDLERLLLGR